MISKGLYAVLAWPCGDHFFAVTISMIFLAGCSTDVSQPPDPDVLSKAAPPPKSLPKPDLQARSPENLAQAFTARLQGELASFDNPWVIAHAILAWGDAFKISGKEPIAHLQERWLIEDDQRFAFPLSGAGPLLGEQHPHLVLKNLVERGLAKDFCRQLQQNAVLRFQRPQSWQDWNDVAWLLEVLARDPQWSLQQSLGDGSSTESLIEGLLVAMEEGDALVEALLASNQGFQRPPGEGSPKKSGIWAYTCSGQHLMQALTIVYQRGWLSAANKLRAEQRLAVYIRRLEAEYEFREKEGQRALAAGSGKSMVLLMKRMFQLKLVGHALEVLSRCHAAGFGDAAQLIQVMTIQRSRLLELFSDVELHIDPKRQMLKALRRRPARWERWFGDGCHALRGLQLSNAILGR